MLNKKGLTLIEVMISLVVLLIVFLGMMQTIAISVNLNVKNALRDEAVSIAEERIVAHKNSPYDGVFLADTNGAPDSTGSFNDDDIDPNTAGPQKIITRSFRNFDIDFTSTRRIDDIGGGNKQVEITISWVWKGENYNHSVSRIVSKP